LPKVVIVVHMAGQPCEMDKIYELSKLYGFDIVEDASHAFGARFGSRVIGDCSFSKVTVFSFHPVKIITTGEGGACTTNDSRIAKKMQIIRSNGVTAQKFYNQNHESCEIWNYEQIYPGFNYRMNDIEAALGISQLKKAEKILNKRTRLANWYYNNLDNLPIILPKQNKNVQSSWHLFIVKLQRTEHILNKTEVFRKLHNLGIGVNLHYIPVYRHPVFSKMGFSRGYCKEAEKYFKAAISLPIFYTMTEDECQTILRCLNNVLK
jgi:dTDP-4-amino-4,6-dideoxygalactose transaminase